MWSDFLSTREAEYTQHAIKKLSKVRWAESLLIKFQKAGGLKKENMPLMFEIRYAHELHLAGIEPKYGYKTGVGGSDVDFRIPGSPEWLVELYSLNPPKTNKNEMIRTQEKIGEKIFDDGVLKKFPIPEDKNLIHIILVDIRGYISAMGDIDDFRQIAYGEVGVEEPLNILCCDSGPIKGIFEVSNPQKAIPFIQERIHFLGFICEKDYREGEISNIGYYLPNPHLLSNEEVTRLAQSYPLKRQAR